MNRRRRQAPQLEPLEGKQLLTTVHPAALAIRQAQVATAAHAFTLGGSFRLPAASVATFTQNGQNVGTFRITGRLGTMGQVTGTFVGLLKSDNVTLTNGEMLLSNRRGAVYLAMVVDPSDTTSYDSTVQSGTQAFVGAAGSGKMSTTGVAGSGKFMNFKVTMNAT